MRVLLLAEDDGLYARGAETLRERGHDVIGCHDAGSAANRWPCSGVEGVCPLDEGVDAAVALRRSQASRVDSGVGCVVRQHIPLIIGGAGGSIADGVAPYAAAIVDGVGPELAEAVDKVTGQPVSELSAAATAGATTVAQNKGISGEIRAEVHRTLRRLTIVIHGPEDLDASARSALAQGAFAPVRELMPAGAIDSIDVGFRDEST